MVRRLNECGIELVSIKDQIGTITAISNKAMFKMLAVLAKMDRDLISGRTRVGLESARVRKIIKHVEKALSYTSNTRLKKLKI